MKASVWTLLVCFLGAYTVACSVSQNVLIIFLCFLGRVVAQEDIAYEDRARNLSCETDLAVHHLPLQWVWVSVSRIAYRVSDDAIHGLSSRGSSRR